MIVLASRSPRRAALLRAAGIEFTVRIAEIDEAPLQGEDPEEYVSRIALQKGLAVHAEPDEIVLAADTTVVAGREILGKPADAVDAARMLRMLSGRKHDVLTGVCLRLGSRILRETACTHVWFAPLTDAEIDDYVSSGEPMDKAGAYGIQGLASRYIDRIDGSYTNVVGLPIALVYQKLIDFQTDA